MKLGDFPLGVRGGRALAEALGVNYVVEDVDLGGCDVGPEAAIQVLFFVVVTLVAPRPHSYRVLSILM